MAEILIKILLGALLLICGIQDIKKQKIQMGIILLGIALTIACLPFCHSIALVERLSGFAIGVGVLFLSKATAGKIGMGDGLLLCITGLGLGFWPNLGLFGIALLFAAIISIVLLVFRLADRKKSIPFVPFLLIAYAFVLAAERGNII